MTDSNNNSQSQGPYPVVTLLNADGTVSAKSFKCVRIAYSLGRAAVAPHHADLYREGDAHAGCSYYLQNLANTATTTGKLEVDGVEVPGGARRLLGEECVISLAGRQFLFTNRHAPKSLVERTASQRVAASRPVVPNDALLSRQAAAVAASAASARLSQQAAPAAGVGGDCSRRWCERCTTGTAILHCVDCACAICSRCDAFLHKATGAAFCQHVRQLLLNSGVCAFCEARHSELECDGCGVPFCHICFASVHDSGGVFQQHSARELGGSGGGSGRASAVTLARSPPSSSAAPPRPVAVLSQAPPPARAVSAPAAQTATPAVASSAARSPAASGAPARAAADISATADVDAGPLTLCSEEDEGTEDEEDGEAVHVGDHHRRHHPHHADDGGAESREEDEDVTVDATEGDEPAAASGHARSPRAAAAAAADAQPPAKRAKLAVTSSPGPRPLLGMRVIFSALDDDDTVQQTAVDLGATVFERVTTATALQLWKLVTRRESKASGRAATAGDENDGTPRGANTPRCVLVCGLPVFSSFKVLVAVCIGVPCVGVEWLRQCRASGQLVPTDDYLIKLGAPTEKGVPQVVSSRASCLEGARVAVVASSAQRDELKCLIEYAGGRVKDLASPKIDVVVCGREREAMANRKRAAGTLTKSQRRAMANLGTHVSTDWLKACIYANRPQPYDQYPLTHSDGGDDDDDDYERPLNTQGLL